MCDWLDGVANELHSKVCPKITESWLLLILGADATGRLHRLGSNLGARGPHCICQQLSWLHVGAVLTLELCWIQVGPCWVHVGATWSLLGPRRLMFNQNWDYFAGMFRRNGSIWANFELLLGLCWPMWGLCWGQVCPSRAMLGLWQTGQPDFVSKT